MNLNLFALPAFADNDLWMLHDGARAVVEVEPDDAALLWLRFCGCAFVAALVWLRLYSPR